jgi:hypothetical protein
MSKINVKISVPFEGSDAHKAIEILLNLKTGVPLNLLVRTSEQIRERIEMEDFFMREIINKGKLLYESNNTGMD